MISMELTNDQLRNITNDVGTPFYLMHPERYVDNVNEFLSAFSHRYQNVIAAYSFKTNYVPALCEIARVNGFYAEVVSEMELELAIKLGFENIILNGPIKKPSVIDKAIDHNVIINLDAEYEVDYLCEYKAIHKDRPLRVGIRVNVRLVDKDGLSVVQSGLKNGRFGFTQQNLLEAINKLRESAIEICSIHGHSSSSDRAAQNYKVISEYMLSICEQYHLDDVQYFNIGGGFFGAAPLGFDITGRPTYQDYADIVLNCVLKNSWFMERKPFIVIEPGSSVVSNVFEYYTQVFQLKTIGKKNFVIVDGTVFDVKPTLHTSNLPFSCISFSHSQTDNDTVYDVVGSTCMEKDIILHDVELPKLKKGDLIQIRGVGAYTISLTPTFINFLSPVLRLDKDGKIIIVRRRQSIDDIISIYTL